MSKEGRRAALAVLALIAFFLPGCGSGDGNFRPTTFDDLSSWLKEAGECDGVETSLARLPVPPAGAEATAPDTERFNREAILGGLVGCGGANGYISYFKFPSARSRKEAVQRHDGLISNELFCARGPELVVNDLLGHDDTADFCKRLGFPIHRPTHLESATAQHRHHLEATAAHLYAHAEGFPFVNVYCEVGKGRLEFACGNFVGGEVTNLAMVKKHGRLEIDRLESGEDRQTDAGR